MMGIEQIAFLEILTFIAGALLLVGLGSLTSALLQPNLPNEAKLCTYESGEVPTGGSWGKFNARFYVIAIIFMLFEAETVLLFPWAMVWANPTLNEATEGLWARYTAMSIVLFIVPLGIGLAYMWRQGHLASTHPCPIPPTFASKVPKAHYEQINHRYASTPRRLQHIQKAK
ncbi:MAG: NADH-quinone oxidoreductase subunit A [Amoebophilaceae bacterium]|jgi:NADH-quinone oxidoreductase subunit A|nr:NADH-quinone oxidoreductase subunit A [Amoebophilaceae bacterium]